MGRVAAAICGLAGGLVLGFIVGSAGSPLPTSSDGANAAELRVATERLHRIEQVQEQLRAATGAADRMAKGPRIIQDPWKPGQWSDRLREEPLAAKWRLIKQWRLLSSQALEDAGARHTFMVSEWFRVTGSVIRVTCSDPGGRLLTTVLDDDYRRVVSTPGEGRGEFYRIPPGVYRADIYGRGTLTIDEAD